MTPVLTSLVILALVLPSPAQDEITPRKWFQKKSFHQLQQSSGTQMREIALMSHGPSLESLLDPMLIPRVVDTENHAKVRKHIVDYMRGLNWTVDVDSFADTTPFGRKNFANVIATLNPGAQRALVLGCHYDSKYSREGVFVGATDSAVPCAMMLHMASTMHDILQKHVQSGGDPTLQFIFFDGEEAFRTWGPTDSIYGARHLAKKLSNSLYPEDNEDNTNHLHRMDVLVLLDLLGAVNPHFYNFFPKTEGLYRRLVEIETSLQSGGLLSQRQGRYFQKKSTFAGIEDDHIPFLRKDVPIVHIIPTPFPHVWHTYEDNKDALDFPTIDDLNRIFRIFVADYLHLGD